MDKVDIIGGPCKTCACHILLTKWIRKQVVDPRLCRQHMQWSVEVNQSWALVMNSGTSCARRVLYHWMDALHSVHEKREVHVDWPRELRGLGNATGGNLDTRMSEMTVSGV